MSEVDLRKDYLQGQTVETLYFGGGTPSLLQGSEMQSLIEKVRSNFQMAPAPEITLETNPDDMNEAKLAEWREMGINRLSIGVQSFYDDDLAWMNRAHDSKQAEKSLLSAIRYFDNITADLIYGSPFLTMEKWKKNIYKMIGFGIPHLSCYALTIEPKTPLDKMIREKKTADINSEQQSEQFLVLMNELDKAGYEHYEISNYAKPGFRSRHNSSYWSAAKQYLGIGPSAHSFDGQSRQWNVANNNIYIDEIEKGNLPFEKEILTPTQKLNEYIMTSLRTIEGLDLKVVEDIANRNELIKTSRKFIDRGLMTVGDAHLRLTRKGKLLADGIAADLFQVEG